MLSFISRGKNGKLIQHSLEWDIFVNELFSMAKNSRELEFIGQLVEDLQWKYEERLEEMEESENE